MRSKQAVIFKPKQRDFDLTEFERTRLIDAYDQIELLGFSLHSHFKLLQNERKPTVKAKDLQKYVGKDVEIYGNLITTKRTTTKNNKYMYFSTFYDSEGTIFDTVHFPDAAKKHPMWSKGIYLCYGQIVEDLGYISINIKWVARQKTAGDPRLADTVKMIVK